MNGSRRSFFQMVAAGSAAIGIGARAEAGSQLVKTALPVPNTKRPVEVDLEDQNANAWRRLAAVNVFVRFDELYPGDPGEHSGVSLRLMEGGRHTVLNAEIGESLQRDGTRLSHCLGYARSAELACFAEAAGRGEPFVLELSELYPEIAPARPSGAILTLFADDQGPVLQLHMGSHCFGVLRGQLLAEFLECLRVRCAMERPC